MPALTYRRQSDPRDGSSRHASVTDARVRQRGFALQSDRRCIGCQPALEDQMYAGFRIEVRTP